MTHPHHFFSGAALILLVILQMSNNVKCNSKIVALFAFGDSFADTGNTKLPSESWTHPYGFMYPGRPTGRWSDGRVWCDFVARFLGLKSPVPYEQRERNPKRIKNGVNFAYGGSGLFRTLNPYPNMSQQIDFFETMMRRNVFTQETLASSVAIIAVSGNDYTKFVVENPNATPHDWKRFISTLIDQLIVNVKRIQGLGLNAIGINGIAPLGCFPSVARRSNYSECDKFSDYLSEFHNNRLREEISKMNKTTPAGYVYVDMYGGFLAAIKKREKVSAGNQLRSCCSGVEEFGKCGAVDENGRRMYNLCEDPKRLFYWDNEHPTQQGWKDVYFFLRSTLRELKSHLN